MTLTPPRILDRPASAVGTARADVAAGAAGFGVRQRAEAPSGRETPTAPPRARGLADARPASRRTRRLVRPMTGALFAAERALNHFLAANVYPRVPAMTALYDRLLDRRLVVSEAAIPIRGLGRGLDGLTILAVTDLHAGPFVSPSAIERTIERLRACRPDVVVWGGDLATCRVHELDPFLPAVAKLTAPLGAFAVLGNHDHYTGDVEGVRARLASAGVRVLHNEGVTLTRGGSSLRLAGIDDWHCGRPDLDAACGPGEPAVPTVLLSHNPDAFLDASDRGVALVISGHTHGGQIRIPGLPVIARVSRYRLDEGRYRRGASEIVVSRGLGAVGLPVRVACPPEVLEIRLESPAERRSTTSSTSSATTRR